MGTEKDPPNATFTPQEIAGLIKGLIRPAIRAGYFLGGSHVALGGSGPLDCHDIVKIHDLSTV